MRDPMIPSGRAPEPTPEPSKQLPAPRSTFTRGREESGLVIKSQKDEALAPIPDAPRARSQKAPEKWSPDEQAMRVRNSEIRRNIGGIDGLGNRMSGAEHREWIRLDMEIREKAQRIDEANARLALDQENQQFVFYENEQRMRIEAARLQIEAEKLKIEKASLVVRALEAAGQSGVSGDKLLAAIADFSEKLLGDGAGDTTRLLTEDNKKT